MPIIDDERDVLILRVVYDGPPFSGKTTTVRTLSEGLGVDIVTPAEKDGRTLAFDWVDYTGPVDGQTVGIAIFSHPENFRHPTRWHVRTYGLFCANPFGSRDFPETGDHEQGAYTIKAGESLTLRYCVYFHPQATASADIPAAYQAYLAR